MKKRFIAAIAAAILTLSCVASVSATDRCRCGGTLEGYACTMPNIYNMADKISAECGKHPGCTLITYYAYSKARCLDCGVYNSDRLTHPCAIAHEVNGVLDDLYSCCQYW